MGGAVRERVAPKRSALCGRFVKRSRPRSGSNHALALRAVLPLIWDVGHGLSPPQIAGYEQNHAYLRGDTRVLNTAVYPGRSGSPQLFNFEKTI
jgi:hypothetical protein